MLLVPGMMGTARDALRWRGLVEPLARTRQVIALSLRGRGDSSAPLVGWTAEHHQQDIAAVLDAWQLPQVHIVAHSMGVGYALEFAQANPQRARSFVSGDYAPWLGQVSREWVTRAASPEAPPHAAQVAPKIYAEQGAPTTVAAVGHESFPLTRDYRPFLATTTMPVLVLQHAQDTDRQELDEWLTVWRDAKTATITILDADHDVLASPDGQAAVRAFLDRQP